MVLGGVMRRRYRSSGAGRPAPRADPPRIHQLTASEIDQAPYWQAEGFVLRISLPTDLLVLQGAFAFAGGWNPLVAALDGGRADLARFYSWHRPATLGEMYGLEGEGVGTELPPWELPWLLRPRRRPPPGEAGLALEEGVSYYGPCTERKIDAEMARLTEVRASIARQGYRPDAYGDVTGIILRGDGEHRFLVRGGKHRAAALASLGWDHVPVTLLPDGPRVVDRRDLSAWPLVTASHMAPDVAAAVFDRYFTCDGTQQRHQGEAAREAVGEARP